MTSFTCKLLLLVLLIANTAEKIHAQKCRFSNTDYSQTLLLKGKRTFNMNRYNLHVVMYVTKLGLEDSLCHVYTDSLKYITDTLLVRACDFVEKGCSDTLIPQNERASFINNSYWQKIPISRIKMIKSKKQPIAVISMGAVIISYAVFVASAVVGVVSKDAGISSVAANIAGISNAVFFLGWGTNVFVAKKRFRFNKLKPYNSYKILI